MIAVRKRAGMIWSVSMLTDGITTVRERIFLMACMIDVSWEDAWLRP